MKLNGSHKFKTNSYQVYNALLNPEILKSCIPGCNSVEYLDPERIRVNLTTPLPGLKGPYAVTIRIAQRQEPAMLVLEVQRRGTGGAINATSNIRITDQADGAMLTYSGHADLEGPIGIANNPIGQSVTKNSLGSFFKHLEKAIAK